MLNFLFRLTGDQKLTEELGEELFSRALEVGVPNSINETTLITLYRIAIKVTAERNREIKPRVDRRSRGGKTIDRLGARKRIFLIQSSLGLLPDGERLAVLLHRYQQLDCAQIGLILSMETSQVKVLLLGAYQSLRNSLLDRQ